MRYKRTIQTKLVSILHRPQEKRLAPIEDEELHRFLRGGLAAK